MLILLMHPVASDNFWIFLILFPSIFNSSIYGRSFLIELIFVILLSLRDIFFNFEALIWFKFYMLSMWQLIRHICIKSGKLFSTITFESVNAWLNLNDNLLILRISTCSRNSSILLYSLSPQTSRVKVSLSKHWKKVWETILDKVEAFTRSLKTKVLLLLTSFIVNLLSNAFRIEQKYRNIFHKSSTISLQINVSVTFWWSPRFMAPVFHINWILSHIVILSGCQSWPIPVSGLAITPFWN